ncbi:MAG: hypothetical protein EA364_03205 [Balneolaceae bacterium]|nr:MAG: hypothetical protein EA364_03205 [Balneolaceae bacterium]
MNRTCRLTLSFLILILLLPVLPAQAQRHFGIIWDPPSGEREAARELFGYQQLGIRSLMIEGIHEFGILDVLHGFDFEVAVSVPQTYLTATELQKRKPASLDLVISHVEYYRNHDFISSFILFSDSQVNSSRFANRASPIIREARISTDIPLLHINGNTRHRFGDTDRPDGVILHLSEAELNMMADPGTDTLIPVAGYIWNPADGFDTRHFQEMLRLTRPAGDVPVYFHAHWVAEHLEDGLEDALIIFAGDSDALLPKPRLQTETPSPNWHIILVILVWISFAVHFAIFPNYNKSLFRYFSNHKFFIEDIFEKRIRFSTTPVFLNLQTAVLFGLFFYTLYSFHISAAGLDVLGNYLPIPDWMHPGIFFFSAGFLFKLIFSALMTFWVFAPSLDTYWLNPAAVTYIWPQQLLLPVISLMITIDAAGGPAGLFNVMAIIFLVIWLSSFYVAAFNLRQYVERKTLYDTLSWALQLAVLGGVFWWAFIQAGLLDVLRLAAFV